MADFMKGVRPGNEHPVPATKIPHNTMYVNRFLDVVVQKQGVLVARSVSKMEGGALDKEAVTLYLNCLCAQG